MNLFSCEENVFKWSQSDPESADGIRPLEDWAAVFAIDMFKRRLEPDSIRRRFSRSLGIRTPDSEARRSQ